MSYKIRHIRATDKEDRFRDLVWAAAGGTERWELVDEDGEVVEVAEVEDGTISFSRKTNKEESA